jgi:hypothetical protein
MIEPSFLSWPANIVTFIPDIHILCQSPTSAALSEIEFSRGTLGALVIKIGIEQITRSHWVWTPYEDNWISAAYVHLREPDQTHKIPKLEKSFNYGFNDFVVAEVTPELASSITGNMEEDV